MRKGSLLHKLYQILRRIEAHSDMKIGYTERSDAYTSNTLYSYIDLFRYRIAARSVKRASKIIDIGSGLGYGIHFLDRTLTSDLSIGVDIDAGAVKYSQKRYGGKSRCFVLCDAMYLPFKGKSFDLITCFETIEHTRSPSKVLQEIHRTLRERGKLIVSTPNNMLVRLLSKKNKPMNPFHQVEFSFSEFKELLSEEGFSVLRSVGFYFPIPVIRRYERLRNSKFYAMFSCHAFSFLPWICLYQLHTAHTERN